jgi:uncharacterized protein
MNRRKFIRNSSLVLGAFATGFYTYAYEPYHLEFTKQPMPIKSLPDFWQGKTIMQISDLHFGKDVSRTYLIDAFGASKKFNPDIVVYTGDFVSYEDEAQVKALQELMSFAPKGKTLTCGVLGNHDYGSSFHDHNVSVLVQNALEANGIKILRNETIQNDGLIVFGVEDFWGPNFSKIEVAEAISKSQAHIVLCHNPDVADLKLWGNYSNWILSGHTHGGQCKPPFLPPPLLPVQNKKYTAGKFELSNDRKLYINRALGNLNHIRFNVRPEITIFKLIQA